MSAADTGRLRGERLPLWLPLLMAAVGAIGAVATGVIVVGSDDDDAAVALADDGAASPTPTAPELTSTTTTPTLATPPGDGDAPAEGSTNDDAQAPATPDATTPDEAEAPGTTAPGDPQAPVAPDELEAEATAEAEADAADDGAAIEGDPIVTAELCPPMFSVRFPLGSATPTNDPDDRVAGLARWMEDHPDATLLVEARGDGTGTREESLRLSAERAEGLADRFVAAGVPDDRIDARGLGERVALGGTEPDADLNQRASVLVIGREQCPTNDEDGTP